MYTEADVARLRLLQRRVEHGHSIGRLAPLSNEELRDLLRAPAASAARRPSRTADAARYGRAPAALRELRRVGHRQEISRLAAVLRPLELLRDVLMPALAQVGDDWHRQRRASRRST